MPPALLHRCDSHRSGSGHKIKIPLADSFSVGKELGKAQGVLHSRRHARGLTPEYLGSDDPTLALTSAITSFRECRGQRESLCPGSLLPWTPELLINSSLCEESLEERLLST